MRRKSPRLPPLRLPDVPSAAGDALRRRIFEMQRLPWMDQRVDCVRGERGLGEAGQDQLELAGIRGDVADRKDPRPRRGAGGGIDADAVVIEIEPPRSER